MDATPLDSSDDYLPTSRPNEWIAKLNPGAEGRMEMLSVLLYEHGYALGLKLSGDAHCFVSPTLTPSIR